MQRSRLKAVADWLLEISALLMVFPVLDSMLQHEGKLGWLAWSGVAFAAITGLVGLYLTPDKERP